MQYVRVIKEVKGPEQLHVCTCESGMCTCALEALLIVLIHKWYVITIDCTSGDVCDLFHTQCTCVYRCTVHRGALSQIY